jgi:hypothetical protein
MRGRRYSTLHEICVDIIHYDNRIYFLDETMAKVVQLDFLEDSEISELKAEFLEVKASCDRVRKRQFSEIGQLKKDFAELKQTVDLLVRNICKS